MTSRDTFPAKIAETTGIVMMFLWTMVIGPAGFLLLMGMAYAMITQNLALGVVCGLLMFAPLVVTALWLPLLGITLLRERWAEKAARASVMQIL